MDTKTILENAITLGGFTLTLLAALTFFWAYLTKSKRVLISSLVCLILPFILCMAASATAILNINISSAIFLAGIIAEAIGISGLMISLWFAALRSIDKKEKYLRRIKINLK